MHDDLAYPHFALDDDDERFVLIDPPRNISVERSNPHHYNG